MKTWVFSLHIDDTDFLPLSAIEYVTVFEIQTLERHFLSEKEKKKRHLETGLMKNLKYLLHKS